MITGLLELYAIASIGASAYGFFRDDEWAKKCRVFGCDVRAFFKK